MQCPCSYYKVSTFQLLHIEQTDTQKTKRKTYPNRNSNTVTIEKYKCDNTYVPVRSPERVKFKSQRYRTRIYNEVASCHPCVTTSTPTPHPSSSSISTFTLSIYFILMYLAVLLLHLCCTFIKIKILGLSKCPPKYFISKISSMHRTSSGTVPS